MKPKTAVVLSAALVLAGLVPPAAAIEWKRCLSQPAKWYGSSEAIRIADNVLLYQRNDGGWHKNLDMAKELQPEQTRALERDKDRNDSTIDNGATCRQLEYLARVYEATGQERFREAFLKGLDYLFAAQYDNGGWPQYYPNLHGYYRHITFNDGAMINVMRLLRAVSGAEPPYGLVEADRRNRAARAVEKGIDCILRCQIVVDGRRTGWCAQHDEKTFEPRPARSYEKASLSGSEGVGVVRFLMEIDGPSPAIVEAVESAVRWFDEARIEGIRVERIAAEGTERGYDRVVVEDPDAGPVWARFYEIGTNRPIFCSRDGIIRHQLSDISYERRNGYSWYTSAPRDLLERDYPRWREKWTPGRNVLDR